MTVADDLANEVRTTQNIDFNTALDTCLLANGFSQPEIDSVKSLYLNIINNNTDLTTLTALAQTHVTNITGIANNLVKANESNIKASETNDAKKGKLANYDPQDAENSKTFPEPQALSQTETNMPSFPPADSALIDNYPNSYGKMDTSGNWYKVNKQTGYLEIVHNSGSSIKIDKVGNVSLHITGKLKTIIDQDFLINILGNHDSFISGNSYNQILGKLTTKIGQTWNITVANVTTWVSSLIKLN